MSNSNFGAVAPELTKVALRVLSIPTSSAAAERNWSTFSYIHDKKRNKLSNDRVFKLVYIYFNNKLKNQKKLQMYVKILMLLMIVMMMIVVAMILLMVVMILLM